MNEIELIHRILEGNQQDFTLLIKKYETNVFRTAIGLVHSKEDGDLAVVSLEFSGLIREAASEGANPFHEIWHIQHTFNTP